MYEIKEKLRKKLFYQKILNSEIESKQNLNNIYKSFKIKSKRKKLLKMNTINLLQ